MSKQAEPAIKSYFFGKGYTDLRDVIQESWQRNMDSANEFFSKIQSGGEWWEVVFSSVFWGGAGISVILFGTIFFGAASLLHIVFLGAFFSLIYAGFTIVWAVERTFLFFRQFFVACPSCHEKSLIPEYLCDKCGNVHSHLMPNSYGILSHQCSCGQQLPATFFTNRGRLQARCPDCHQFLHREHVESRRIFIPVLGGPSSGKTAFLFAVVREMIEIEAPKLGFSTQFIDNNTEADYKRITEQLKRGKAPPKTLATIPKAFNLALKKDGKTQWLLYIYDPSGEAYQDTENLLAHRYHQYLSGMVLIVDPFSIPQVRREFEYELSKVWSGVSPSQLNVEHALARVILTMEEAFGLSKTAKIKQPLAVVISKVDTFGLEEMIGETAVDKAMSRKPGASRSDLRDQLIKKQLTHWSEDALLQQLNMRFKQVRFFSCSALGRIPDSSNAELKARQVFDPIYWICHSVSPADFNAGNKV